MCSTREEFFTLLRYALQASEELPKIERKGWNSIGASDEFPQVIGDWDAIYSLAAKQSLSGVVFYGIQKSGMKPPFELLMQWVAESEIIRSRNEIANKTVLKVSQYFEKRGFRGCILKGQGNTLNYPDLYIRACGDIDIWLEGGREKIMNMVDGRWPGSLARYHHVEIPEVDGIPVEVHFSPSYIHAPWRNKRLQKWFEEQRKKQFANQVTLPGTDEKISIPTREFNIVYQLQHMFSHLFTEGFGLRQVVDYYFVLRTVKGEGLEINGYGDTLRSLTSSTSVTTRQYANDFPLRSLLRWLGLWKFAGGMMWVMREVLNLDEQQMISKPDEKEGRFILGEIMQSVNMGYYDTRLGKTNSEGVVHRYFRMTIRNMRFVKHYPEEALCEPLFRTWCFFRRQWQKFISLCTH